MIPGVIETNLTGSSREGVTVTGDASPDTKGPWSELIASVGGDVEGVWIAVRDLSISSTDTGILLDIGIGAESSEVVLVPDLAVGHADSGHVGWQSVFVPAFIASGTRVAARLQGAVASETAVVAIWLARSIQHLEGGSAAQAVGADAANSRGSSVTPGSGSFGSWASLGTISADRNTFAVRVEGLGSTGLSTARLVVELGYGSSAPGAGGTAIVAMWRYVTSNQEVIAGPFPDTPVYADLASGETLWARAAWGSTTPIGVSVIAIEAPAA